MGSLTKCDACGKSYRNPDHVGSDYCASLVKTAELRALGWVQWPRLSTHKRIAAHFPHAYAMTALVRAPDGVKVYRGHVADERLWVPWWLETLARYWGTAHTPEQLVRMIQHVRDDALGMRAAVLLARPEQRADVKVAMETELYRRALTVLSDREVAAAERKRAALNSKRAKVVRGLLR